MGDRRKPSPLSDVQPDHWLPEYTTDLIDLLHVLAALVAFEPGREPRHAPRRAGPPGPARAPRGHAEAVFALINPALGNAVRMSVKC
jgi:hypothetical protein